MSQETYRPMGPGSLEVSIPIDFDKLAKTLVKAQHPLAYVPQWNGENYYVVILRDDNNNIRVMAITSKDEQTALDMAASHGRSSRNNSAKWEPIKVLRIQDNPCNRVKLDVKVNGLE